MSRQTLILAQPSENREQCAVSCERKWEKARHSALGPQPSALSPLPIKTKRPPLPTVALDEEQRRDSMLQDGEVVLRLIRRRRAWPGLPGCARPCLPTDAGNRAWRREPCRDA